MRATQPPGDKSHPDNKAKQSEGDTITCDGPTFAAAHFLARFFFARFTVS